MSDTTALQSSTSIEETKRKFDEELDATQDAAHQQQKKSRLTRRWGFINQQPYDEVTIKTVPRFRQGVGSEWRFGVLLEVKRKGFVVATDQESTVEEVVRYLMGVGARESPAAKTHFESRCDQEGCAEPFLNTFRLKKLFIEREAEKETDFIRCFCARHSDRGDDLFEDCNNNYELIGGPGTVEHNAEDMGERVRLTLYTETPYDPDREYDNDDDDDDE